MHSFFFLFQQMEAILISLSILKPKFVEATDHSYKKQKQIKNSPLEMDVDEDNGEEETENISDEDEDPEKEDHFRCLHFSCEGGGEGEA